MNTEHKQSVLSEIKEDWFIGDWEKIANINLAEITNSAELAELSLLKASAYQQLDRPVECKEYLVKARELGCDSDFINQILLAGLHNLLGKMHGILNKDEQSFYHFKHSIDVQWGSKRHVHDILTHTRSVRELSRLGLLQQAAGLVENEMENLVAPKGPTSNVAAKMTMLASEMELINNELTLAYKKRQLYTTSDRVGESATSCESGRLEELSPSQLGQDLWVLEKTDYKREGYFVEFGATDGVLLSNTYLLEKEFGWDGLCAEPNPKYFAELKNNRNCKLSNACIAGETGKQVEFIFANEYGGIEEFANSGMHKEKVDSYKALGRKAVLETISLDDFLLANKAPKNIDYLSIDVEGSEYEILKNFPFDKWNIKLITAEHNFEEQREKIMTLLSGLGYQRKSCEWDDWYYKDELDDA